MNQSDITAFRTRHTAPVNDKARAILSTDIEQFLANGGKIESIATGTSGDIYTGAKLSAQEQRDKLRQMTISIVKDRNHGK